MTTFPPPAEKLPLATRKEWRDKWETTKKVTTEAGISEALGVPWTITVNPNQLYVLPEDESYKSQLGNVVTWYMDPFLYNLKRFLTNYGEDGKTELNTLASNHVLEFAPQDKTSFPYGGLEVREGTLRLVFASGKFGSNVDGASEKFAEALATASAAQGGSAFDMHARQSAAQHYDAKIETVRAEIAKQVGVPDIRLEPSWEANAAALKAAGKDARDDWNKVIGTATFDYFDKLLYNLKRNKFEGDEMLQEGFQEAVPGNEIVFRIVDKLVAASGYNEVILEGGKLIVQTTPKNFWTNVDGSGAKILDIL